MQLQTTLRTIEMPISRDLLKQFIEEKLNQFGFNDADRVVNMELKGVPETIPMTIKFQREKEVEIIEHNGRS